MLRDLSIAPYYRSDRHNLLTDFYLPCLGESNRYSRAVGYFTSDSLSAAAKGLYRLIGRRGYVRLVASPFLTKEDVEAIREGYRRREQIIERALLRGLQSPEMSESVTHRLGFLAWLIGEGLLDIKIALVETTDLDFGVYHEKIGIFEDEAGNRVVFSGSANESMGGFVSNFESIEVYRSWVEADVSRIRPKVEDFEDLWHRRTPKLRIYDFPEAARRALLRFRPGRTPTRDPEEIEPPDAGATDLGIPSIPTSITLREYQKAAVEAWFANGGQGIWRMATGTGKTIAALALVSQLFRGLREQRRTLIVVVVCPFKHLVQQWASEARRFNIVPIKCFESRELWCDKLFDSIIASAGGSFPFVMAITTTATFQGDAFQEVLARIRSPLLILADEVHNLGAARIRQVLPDSAQFRLGLSATPERWYDEAGTEAVFRYFGNPVFELGLADAIRLGALAPYDYFPHVVELEDDEAEEYIQITAKIARLVGSGDSELTDETEDEVLKHLLLQRARVLALARGKLPALESVVRPLAGTTHNLFYCGDGQVQYQPGAGTIRQLDAVVHLLGVRLGMRVNSYTAETYLDERDALRQEFASGALQSLVAIRCLDEGIDIPETRSAFILASSSNPKQFIQRRGRILRRAPGKGTADIHDFVTVPPVGSVTEGTFAIERRLLRRELQRVILFADLAENGPVALRTLLPLRMQYHLLDVE